MIDGTPTVAASPWDPFQEDADLLGETIVTEAGLVLLASASMDDGTVGFGRVYATGGSLRLYKLLLRWGWAAVPREQRGAADRKELCIDVPFVTPAKFGLVARALAAEAFAQTLDETFSGEGARFVARPVEVQLTDVRAGGPPEAFVERERRDRLVVDPLSGWSRRDVWTLLASRSIAAMNADLPRPAPAAWIHAEIDRRLKRLDDVRDIFGLDLGRVATPGLATVRRLMAELG